MRTTLNESPKLKKEEKILHPINKNRKQGHKED
jgi:hypothetical protein